MEGRTAAKGTGERRRDCERRQPSFSSSLLDAIYHSMDESDAGRPAPARMFRRSPDPSLYCKVRHPHHREPVVVRGIHDLPGSLRAVSKQQRYCNYYYHYNHRQAAASSSSSSDGSSYGGFSSSDAESACTARPTPIRTASLAGLPRPGADLEKKNEKQATSIRGRIRDLRKARPPVSPGARLASFINSLFAAGASVKKPKVSAAAAAYFPSASSSASSFSRSCLSKTPSSRGRAEDKRSVRFGPVSFIAVPGDEKRSCGQKRCYGHEPSPPPPPPPPPRRRVEEILRAPHDAEEDESDDVASDASSDLFELENLTASSWVGGGYRDELPVYETTHFPAHLTISQVG